MTIARLARILSRRLGAALRRRRLDDDLDRELAFHVDQLAAEYAASGLSPADARAAARRALGNVAALADECRDTRGVAWLHDLRRDLLIGARSLAATPGLTCVVVLSLALGIGANTAVFGAMQAVLRGPLPVADPDRVVVLRTFPLASPQLATHASLDEYFAWRDRNRSFEAVAAGLGNQTDFGDPASGIVERVTGHAVTPEFFAVLGTRPLLGRVLTAADVDAASARRVIVLSYRLWQRRYGGDRTVVGRDAAMNGGRARIVGVMPEGFSLPEEGAEYWIPLRPDPSPVRSPERFFVVTARLRRGVTIGQATSDVEAIHRQLAAAGPRDAGRGARVERLRDRMYGWTRGPLQTLQAAVALVLLVACANVASLLLARAVARQPEIALRSALGAGRLRLVRQFLAESLLLAAAGGVCGVAVAWAGLRILLTITPPPGGVAMSQVGVGGAMLATTAAIALATGVLFGLAPAIVGSRVPLAQSLRPRPWHRPALRHTHLREVLVAVQIAITCVLLVGAGLMLRSLDSLLSRDLGFDPEALFAFDVQVPVGEYMHRSGSLGALPYFEIDPPPSATLSAIASRLRTIPGVDAVAGISYAPLTSLVIPRMTVSDGRSAEPAEDARTAAYLLVTPDYFRSIRATVVAGRDITARDHAGAPWVAVVNETAARMLWPGAGAVGRQLRLPDIPEERPRDVVGVVRDIPLRLREIEPQPVVYTSYLQQPSRYPLPGANMFGRMTFLVRSRNDHADLRLAAERAVSAAAPGRPLIGASPLQDRLRVVAANRGSYEMVVAALAASAALLAGIGVYGVMAYSVARRTREIGIRIALGAGTAEIVRRVSRPALAIAGAGLVAGVASALVLMRGLSPQLWGITPNDPPTLAAALLVMLAVCALACFVPARRAAAVNATLALRAE